MAPMTVRKIAFPSKEIEWIESEADFEQASFAEIVRRAVCFYRAHGDVNSSVSR